MPPENLIPFLTDQTKPTMYLDSWWNTAMQRMEVLRQQQAAAAGQPAEDSAPASGQLLWMRKVRLVVYGGGGDGPPIPGPGGSGASAPTVTPTPPANWQQSIPKDVQPPTLRDSGFGGVPVDPGTNVPVGSSVSQQATSAQQPDGPQSGLDLSDMRIVFQVKKRTIPEPNMLYAKVYNLSKETVEKVKQYHRVQLSAGYRSLYGMIFDGTVILYVVGKENPTDTYIEIFAGDADLNINAGANVLTFPAGTTNQQKAEAYINAMNLQKGEINLGPGGQQKSIRQHVFAGMGVDGLRDLNNATSTDFFVDDGKAYVIPWTGYRQGDVVKLSPTTGLVNIPKVTPEGVEVQCLLNPKVRLAGLFNLDSKWLSNVPFLPGSNTPYSAMPDTPFGGDAGPNFTHPAGSVSFDQGLYKILFITHYGDTRGNPWYTSMVGIAAQPNGEVIAGVVSSAIGRSAGFTNPTAG